MSSLAQPNDPWVVFDYETDMFFGLCGLLPTGNEEYAALPHRVRNAVVESALLHCRQLAEILLSSGTRADDINVNRLIPNCQPARLHEFEQAYGKQNSVGSPCWTINKFMAHPTNNRSTSHDYSAVLNQLAPLIADIVNELRTLAGKP